MRRLGTMCLLLSCLTVILLGCTPKFVKRWEFEDRFAKLSKVYPTKKAEDLFDKFPNGFEIEYGRGEKIADGYLRHNISLEGNPKTKEIQGVYTKVKINDRGKEELVNSKVFYEDSKGLYNMDNQDLDYNIKNIDFLFTKMSLDKSYFSKLKSNSLTESPVSGDYSISYSDVQDNVINSYLRLPKETKIKLWLHGDPHFDREDKYYTTVSVTLKNQFDFWERVIEK